MATRRGFLSDDLAEALLALLDPSIAVLLDREDRASAAVRERLAHHPNIAMREATRRTARDWITNGQVPLNMLARLTDKAGQDAWLQLVSDPDPQVRRAVANAWFDAPDSVRRVLLTDPEPSVRAAACRWPPPAPRDLHAQLIEHPATRASVAEYIELNAGLAAELAADNDEDVRMAVANNPHLPDFVRERLANSDEPIVWATLICNQITPESLRARLYARLVEAAKHREGSVEVELASFILLREVPWLRELPLDERLAYLDSPYSVFRRSLAWHTDLPELAVTTLQRDPDPEVRRVIARRLDAPSDFLEQVVRECGENHKYRPLLVDHPNFPKAAFAKFAEEPEPRLRALACRDPQLPAFVVARLSRDENAFVRVSAAGHPNVPPQDLMRLLRDQDPDVVEAAAASRTLPLDAMQQLAALTDAGFAPR